MRLYRIAIVFTLLSLLLLVRLDYLHGYKFRWCSYYYRFSKDIQNCVKCTDRCPRGTGLNKNCGYDYNGNRIQPACSVCPPGFFSKNGRKRSTRKLAMPCRRCTSCYPPLKVIRHCSSRRNTKCSECPHGYYKHSNGRCYKCSYCCDGMLETGVNVVKACQRAGMGRCSCREYTVCFEKKRNAKCQAYKNGLEQNTIN